METPTTAGAPPFPRADSGSQLLSTDHVSPHLAHLSCLLPSKGIAWGQSQRDSSSHLHSIHPLLSPPPLPCKHSLASLPVSVCCAFPPLLPPFPSLHLSFPSAWLDTVKDASLSLKGYQHILASLSVTCFALSMLPPPKFQAPPTLLPPRPSANRVPLPRRFQAAGKSDFCLTPEAIVHGMSWL